MEITLNLYSIIYLCRDFQKSLSLSASEAKRGVTWATE